MINLAGNENCDRDIRRELERARIPVVEIPRVSHEVAFSLIGELGEFRFHRAWRYWIVNGPVPLKVARELYADPVGKMDVRVAGHCGCPPPDDWANYYDAEGKDLCVDADGSQQKEGQRFIDKGFIDPVEWAKHRFVATKEERDLLTVRAAVLNYHIDTEVGLRLFVDTIVRHGIVASGSTLTQLDQLRRSLTTDDNACTADPIFLVQKLVYDYGIDEEYTDDIAWFNSYSEEEVRSKDHPERFAELERGEDRDDDGEVIKLNRDGWYRRGYRERWETVQPFLTRGAADAFRERQAHNLPSSRVYVESAYRNPEWRWLREFFGARD